MANYNKSFNFRNGVQVDDDNFIVNANGLVGIGTSIPREFLDVHGTAKVTGLVTATNLAITGVSTFYGDVKVGSAITFNPSTGAVRATTFFGSAVGLTDIYAIAVDGWYVNAGNLSTTSKVGIGTTLPYYSLQVGQDPITGNGFSVDALTGNTYSSGIVTAASRFSGNLTGNINSSGVSTFTTLRVGTGVTISGGIVTATSFVGSLSGTATTTTNIPNLTGAITSNNTTTSLGSFTSAQLATALSDETGSGANVFATSPTLVTPTLGNATATSITVSSGVTINSGGITASAGIITASVFVGTLTGNVVGIASTARDLTSNARVSIAHIASQTSSIGISTVSTRLYAESIGVGTNSPSSDIHIRRSSTSRLQVTSDTAEAIIAIGRSTTLNGNNGALIFGNTAGIYPYSDSRTLDIVNYSTGSLNYYLNYSGSGGNNGDFNWIYAPDATNPLMTLTYGGNLGIGVTNPTSKLEIFGTSSFVGIASFNDNVNISNDLTINGNLILNGSFSVNAISATLLGNVNTSSGISTFNNINATGDASSFRSFIGIGTQPSNPAYSFEVLDTFAVSSAGVGIGTNLILPGFDVTCTGTAVFGTIGIGTDSNTGTPSQSLQVGSPSVVLGAYISGNLGVGVANPVDKLTVRGGDISVGINTSNGLVLTSDNGTKYRLFVSNAGVLSTVLVP
jgi:hypothetical protein